MQQILEKLKKFNGKFWFVAVLAAVGILGLVMTLFKPNPKIVLAAEQAPVLAEKIRQSFQIRNNYWGLDTSWVIRQQLAPVEMIDGQKLINELGKPVLVGGGLEGSKLMPNARNFNIIYKNLDRSECVGIASFRYSEKNLLGLISMTIVTDKDEKVFAWGTDNPLPITGTEAKQACKNSNTLIFTFE